jgi:Bacterial Ig-like domain (group 3)
VTVKVANSDGSTYVGTVHFTNSSSGATLPSDYTFTTADAGTHKFASGVTLGTSGSQTITAADAHQPSTAGKATVTVGGGKSATTTTLTSSVNPSTYRQPVTFTAVVTATSGSPTGLVTFKDGSSTLGTGTVSGGVASVMVSTLAVGTHSITAAYGGDTNYLSSTSAAHTQTVSKASTTTTLSSSNNPSTFGGSVTFRAIVSSAAGAPPNTEIVKFMDGTTTLGTGSLAAGVASFTTSALTAGTHKIKATYAGDSSYSGSSSLVLSQLVKGLPTTSTVSSNLNPSVYGQTITFKATVVDNSKSGTPTGTVTFKSGTTILAKGIALSGGTASFATSTLAVGIKSITVTYSGDTKYAVSTSAAISQTVTKATSTTTITSSLNPSTVGQSVTFKVSVKPRYAGVPTGTVKLTFGLTVLATVSLANGTASYTTTTLPKGSDVIKATYSGSANFSGSAGSITQTVN